MIIVKKNNILSFKNKNYKCVLGKNGLTNNKTEGDKKTPTGVFSIGELYIRADKIKNLKTSLNVIKITKNMAWCDDPTKKSYNKLIKTSKEHKESLYRNDDLYDILLVIKYNMNPIIPYKGSAIFLHNVKINYENTNGCIALKMKDLKEILKSLSPNEKITITNDI